MPHKVLFACVHNAGRSQIAAAFFRELADPERAEGLSAGTAPAPRVHPVVLTAMQEVGIDLSGAVPRLLTPELQEDIQHLVTMGCGERCPLVPAQEREDWELPDPAGEPLERVRAIRDQIRARVEHLVETRGWARVHRRW
jgi:arsenate reductase